MTRAPVVRALLALLVLALSVFFTVTKDPRLGLDLRGGTQIVLETKDSPTTVADAESTDRALEVLRRRVDALGVAEPTLARSGERRIIVELPGVQDPAAAQAAVGRTAQLTFHPVRGPGDPAKVVGAPTPEPGASGTPSPSASPGATPSPSASASPSAAATPSPSASPTPDALSEAGTRPQLDTSVENHVLDEDGQPVLLGPAQLTGEGVGDASAQVDPQTGIGRFVQVSFRGDGGRAYEELTAAAACAPVLDDRRRIAIVLDGEVITSPQVAPDVQCGVGIPGGTTQITGDFTLEEAQDLAVLIKGGALPVPVEVISRSTVGPTLGEEAIEASLKAGIIGLSLTALFLVVVYRLVGFLAAVALASYGLISYGALVGLGATLTLPGLGGLLLSAGLAIDANVLVFERAREEYAGSRTKRLLPALDNGFNKAFSAIADSNITTLLAAVLLFLFAAGPVRGFGVTLTIGVIASVVSALLVTRVLVEFAVRRKALGKRPSITGLASLGRFREYLVRRNPDLMQYRKKWLLVSAVAVLIAVAGMFVRGFNFGIEFTGGRVVEYATAQAADPGEVRGALGDIGYPQAVVQETGDGEITVRTARITDEEELRIREAVAEVGGGQAEVVTDNIVGPTLGSELRQKAIIALVVALIAQLAYLAVRFRWTFASAAVLAMFHDVLIVVGVFAWLGKPIDGIFLAAALTIIGVSVNDSIVTLDRIRETWANNRTKALPSVVNDAIIATAPRTINTGIGAMFILAALTLLGGASLTDFALALLIGLVVGTYSSAFTASPLLLELEKRNSAPPPMPKRKQQQTARKKGAPVFATRGGGAIT